MDPLFMRCEAPHVVLLEAPFKGPQVVYTVEHLKVLYSNVRERGYVPLSLFIYWGEPLVPPKPPSYILVDFIRSPVRGFY